MMVRWSGEVQVNVKSQSELDISGHETFECRMMLCVFNTLVTAP